MARIRTIKPEFFQDEDLAKCSPHARLLAIALLQLCDSNGVFRNIPMQVHAHAFPWEAEVKTPMLLRELERIGYIKTYRVEGKNYGFIPGFSRHQRLSGKEAQSQGNYPGIDKADQEVSDEKQEGSDNVFPGKQRDAQEREREREREREQGKGTGNRGSGEAVIAVFDHWRTTMNHERAQLDDKRRKRISAALKLGYSAEDLMRAITGYTNSPHHMGVNDRNTRYDSLELLLRDAEHIDKGLQFFHLRGKQFHADVISDKCAEAWRAYSNAYYARYGVEPVSNPDVMASLAKVVDRLGPQDAPPVAAFFLQHNNAFYVAKGHSVGLLLADAEKLRTEWATGRTVTHTQARQADRTASNPFVKMLESSGVDREKT